MGLINNLDTKEPKEKHVICKLICCCHIYIYVCICWCVIDDILTIAPTTCVWKYTVYNLVFTITFVPFITDLLECMNGDHRD